VDLFSAPLSLPRCDATYHAGMSSRTHSPSGGTQPSYLHGIIRSRTGELYAEKRSSFEKLLAAQKMTLGPFTQQIFRRDCFTGTTISKAQLVLELLKDELSPISWRLIRDRLRTRPFLTDRRHTEEYAFDVALGWLEEELLIKALEKPKRLPEGTVIDRVGVDSEREFLSRGIKATADIEIRTPHKRLRVDIFVDHKGTWKKNGGMDLKQGKLNDLDSGQLDYVLGLDLVAGQFYLADRRATGGVEPVANAAMGGTKTARIPLGCPLTLEATSEKFAAELRKS